MNRKMSEKSENLIPESEKSSSNVQTTLPHGDVVQQSDARATLKNNIQPNLAECDIPIKKRKTRRGKSKRKPYQKYGSINKKCSKLVKNKIIKPEAPHNSNQFLLEDHGMIEELDEKLKYADQVSTSTLTRTRDSSLSVDSDGEFYSSPDDEDKFLLQDFDDQYRKIQVEQLQTMSKSELIEEYMLLENRYQQEQLSTRRHQKDDNNCEIVTRLQREVDKLKLEKEQLQKENDLLREKLEQSRTNNCDSEDSETDSSDSCSSSSSSSTNSRKSCISQDFSGCNGHTSPPAEVDPV